MDKKSYCIAWLMLLFVGSLHAQYRTTTYCNPLNLDYTYPFHNSHLGKSYRSGADPAVVEFRGEYYMSSAAGCFFLTTSLPDVLRL